MDAADKIAIGERIRTVRTEQGLSREQLSEMVNISALFLGFIECGQRGMSLDTLCALCRVLNISADYILFGKHENTSSKEALLRAMDGFDEAYLPVAVEQMNVLKRIIAQVNHQTE